MAVEQGSTSSTEIGTTYGPQSGAPIFMGEDSFAEMMGVFPNDAPAGFAVVHEETPDGGVTPVVMPIQDILELIDSQRG